MSNYEKLINRFTAAGNAPEVAKKAALKVLGCASGEESWSEIQSKFNPAHHAFILEIIESEKAKISAIDDEADDYEEKVKAVVAEIDAALPMGHYIRYARLEEMAIDVMSGETTIHEAITQLTSRKPILKK